MNSLPRRFQIFRLGILIGMTGLLHGNSIAQNQLDIFGYFSTRYEKTWHEPALESGGIGYEDSPAEFMYPFFNVMLQQRLGEQFRLFLNFNGDGASTVQVGTFWGEYAPSSLVKLRLGRIYRKFGLYNEILSAVPTYYGIEPPELFDFDHLMVTRTTAFMVFGEVDVGKGKFAYSLNTDNGEGGARLDDVPMGWDVNYRIPGFVIGTSGYYSGGPTSPDKAVGAGSPRSGVLPWMEEDEFHVLDAYTQLIKGALTLQTEFTYASHAAIRNPEAVLTVLSDGDVLPTQRERFLLNRSGADTAVGNVRTTVDYEVMAWYIRGGYSIFVGSAEWAPYLQWDWYLNPETVQKKKVGGDNEAGASDDGEFHKSTVGLIFRPLPQVACKLDQSFHFYTLDSQRVFYPEVRIDVSYIFGH